MRRRRSVARSRVQPLLSPPGRRAASSALGSIRGLSGRPNEPEPPETSSVRGREKGVLVFVVDQIHDPHVGEIPCQVHPCISPIKQDENSSIPTDVDRLRIAGRNYRGVEGHIRQGAAVHVLPRPAPIRRAEDMVNA